MSHAEMWEDVWHEVAPGTEIMLNRHIESVCSLLAQTLQSPSWNMKAQVMFIILEEMYFAIICSYTEI